MKKFVCRFPQPATSTPIYCGSDILHQCLPADLYGKYSSVLAVVDETVYRLHRLLLSSTLSGVKVYRFPSGERYKTHRQLFALLEWLMSNQADRRSLLIAIGGGVVTDITGLAASCYMRGIDTILIPTTLLGQIDAAIGGKTAINYKGIKNIIGSFHPPRLVVCDQHFLETLPRRSIKDGLVEAVKLFAAYDAESFARYSARIAGLIKGEGLETLVADAVRLKVEIVNRDPWEQGLRRVLNFGHTTGHAYETLTCSSHGRAIALGMLVALRLSRLHLDLSAADHDKIGEAILSIYRRYNTNRVTPQTLWQKIKHDKKCVGREISYILVDKPGSYREKPITYQQFKRAWYDTREWYSR